MLLASLPMYARPELDAANDALWGAIRDALRDEGIAAPKHLSPNGVGYAFWEDPNLLFSQTCGYPYRARLHDKVTVVGTPNYGLRNCATGHYCSVFVVRASAGIERLTDLSTATLAYNDPHSQSGYHSPLGYAATLDLQLLPTLATGSHRASAEAVAEGQADVAAIDAITWRHLQTYDPFAVDLKIVGHTPPEPGLPFITGQHHLREPLRRAVITAVQMDDPQMRPLGMIGLVDLPYGRGT